ncbi:MAG: restriction endonuclease [Clostridia bacterium]|nr:restriction endonuclease [Clostridia bacterium]
MKTFKRILFVLLFIVLLPVLIIEGAIIVIRKSIKKHKWKKSELNGHKLLLSNGITDIDLMEGYMFEDYLKVLFFYAGYKVHGTKKSKDYGADLILTDATSGQKIAVQAKRYSKLVGSHAVQEIIGAKIHYGTDEAWVVSNNVFTPQAEQLAKENQIRLIDRTELIEIYSSVCEKLKIANSDGTIIYEKTDLANKYPFYI